MALAEELLTTRETTRETTKEELPEDCTLLKLLICFCFLLLGEVLFGSFRFLVSLGGCPLNKELSETRFGAKFF